MRCASPIVRSSLRCVGAVVDYGTGILLVGSCAVVTGADCGVVVGWWWLFVLEFAFWCGWVGFESVQDPGTCFNSKP